MTQTRLSSQERQQKKLAEVLHRQPNRRCSCQGTLKPTAIQGWSLLGSSDVIALAYATYECEGCRQRPVIPTVSTVVFLSVLLVIFAWVAVALTDPGWHFDRARIIFSLVVYAPGLVTLLILIRTWRARRRYRPAA